MIKRAKLEIASRGRIIWDRLIKYLMPARGGASVAGRRHSNPRVTRASVFEPAASSISESCAFVRVKMACRCEKTLSGCVKHLDARAGKFISLNESV